MSLDFLQESPLIKYAQHFIIMSVLQQDPAGVGRRSPSEKKECMANKIKDQQLGPGGLKHLCIFIYLMEYL